MSRFNRKGYPVTGGLRLILDDEEKEKIAQDIVAVFKEALIIKAREHVEDLLNAVDDHKPEIVRKETEIRSDLIASYKAEYRKWTIADLRDALRQKGILGDNMTKAELVHELAHQVSDRRTSVPNASRTRQKRRE